MRQRAPAGLRRVLLRLLHAFGHRRTLRLDGMLPEPRIFLGPF